MRKILKRTISIFLVPLTKWYLRKERSYQHGEFKIRVFSQVFHPGYFSSTQFLLRYLKEQQLGQKTVLELGCGTGMISIVCASRDGRVTASDLSLRAIENTEANALQAGVSLTILHSDLFDRIPLQKFDWIIINPPYYARKIETEEQLAWYCGEDFQYFKKLFSQLKSFTHPNTNTVMVLSLDCNKDKIHEIASQHKFKFQLLLEKNVLLDGKNFIYQIKDAT
jgi:release factor glutamine methyltransferase